MLPEARIRLATVKPIPLNDDEVAVKLIWNKIINRVRMISPSSDTSLSEISQLAGAISKLITAQCQVERAEIERIRTGADHGKYIEIAKEQLKSDIRRIIGTNPQLIQQLSEVVEEAEGQELVD
jgi:hypothetical protein